VTGQSFDALMHDTVLAPLGMDHSTFAQPLSPNRLGEAAMPANGEGRGFKDGPRIYPELAPDGLWTTASDLARYAIGVQRSLVGMRGSFLTVRTAHLMLTPRLNHFGLGLIVGDDARHPYFTHSGGNQGYACLLVAYNRGDGAVIMTNSREQGSELAIELVRSIAHEYDWPDFKSVKRHVMPIDPKTLDDYVGVYQSDSEIFFVLTREGPQLFIHGTGHAREPLFPITDGRFFLKDAFPLTFFPRDDEVEIAFRAGAAKAAQLDVLQNGITPIGSAKRMPDGAAVPIFEKMAALENRINAQQPVAGEDSALRRLFSELALLRASYRTRYR
jgi:hypothetical protein